MNMSVVEVNANDWEKEVMQYKYLVVVDFWHQQCPWCLKLNPVFAEVAEEYEGKVKFVKLNVLENEENRGIALEHGIMGTPTLIFFCEGRSVETVTGFQPKERLVQTIDDVIAKHKDCIEQSTTLETE